MATKDAQSRKNQKLMGALIWVCLEAKSVLKMLVSRGALPLVFCFLPLALPVAAEVDNWDYKEEEDDFDGLIKSSSVSNDSATIYVIEIGGEIDIGIDPREPNICPFGDRRDNQYVYADFIFIAEHEKKKAFKERAEKVPLRVSRSRKLLIFPDEVVPYLLRILNSVDTLKMRYIDACSNVSRFEFDIRGYTGFGKSIRLEE